MFTFDAEQRQSLKDALRDRNSYLLDQMFGVNATAPRPMHAWPGQGTQDATLMANFTSNMVEYVSNEIERMDFQELTWRRVFSINSNIPAWADTYTRHELENTGEAKALGEAGNDYPVVEFGVTPSSRVMIPYGLGWYVTYDMLLRATQDRQPIPLEQAQMAARGVEEKMDQLAWLGDSAHGVQGIIGHTGIPHNDAATGNWASATAAQIEADILAMINNRRTATGLTGITWRLVLPITQYDRIHQVRLNDYTEQTIAGWLVERIPQLAGFEVSMRLVEAAADDDDLGVLIPVGAQYGAALVSQDKVNLGPHEKSITRTDYLVRSKCGGFWTLKPLVYEIIEGI